jgi:hypothetical protein
MYCFFLRGGGRTNILVSAAFKDRGWRDLLDDVPAAPTCPHAFDLHLLLLLLRRPARYTGHGADFEEALEAFLHELAPTVAPVGDKEDRAGLRSGLGR